MNTTRPIALSALGLAIALAVGALQPARPEAAAGGIVPIFRTAPALAAPTMALPTEAPTVAPPPLAVEPPTPIVVYVQLPPPQVVYVEQPPEVVYVESPPEVVYVEQAAAPTVDLAAEDAGLWAAYNADTRPEVQCPCDAAPLSQPITERERQYSRERTR